MEKRRPSIGLIALIAALVCILVLGKTAYSMLTSSPAPEPQRASAAQSSGPALPAFPLLDARGAELTSTDLLSGKPMVINIWATWCPYCLDEMPDYQRLYEKYGTRVEFVMVDAADGQRETVEVAADYIARNGFTFPVYYDTTGKCISMLGINAYPTSIIVSAEGEVLVISPGRISYDAVDATLAELAAS